uniref:Uncharacterized protein n=1 Tax=Cuerna arida TaxID=1464854 RepID=A0A1B6G304_9HEMI
MLKSEIVSNEDDTKVTSLTKNQRKDCWLRIVMFEALLLMWKEQLITQVMITSFHHYQLQIEPTRHIKNHEKRRWSSEEKGVVLESFKHKIDEQTNPSLKECRDVISTSPVLSRRPFCQIKTFINEKNKLT